MRTSWLSLLILLGLIKSTSQSTNTTCDLSLEFDCGIGILGCLPKAWQCDNIKYCHNGADEIDCEPNECKEGELLCENGECMESKYRCDGVNDCGDWSDEKYCEYNSRRLNVPAPFDFEDPSLYSNESGFDKNGCLPGFGYCSSQICIPNRSFCDGHPDCYVGFEDERNCTQDKSTEISSFWNHFANPCKDKFVCGTNETYKDEVCIQMDELCNGKEECPLGDDESEKCRKCSTKGCGHHCTNTPTGAKCECRKGYRLNSDGVTCVDLDECTLPERACDHFCKNQIGSFRCSCAKGYHLKDDGKSCELTNPSKGSLLLSFRNEIEERPLEDFSRTNFTSIYKFNGTIHAFDYFYKDHKLFMMTCNESLGCRDAKLVMKEDGKPTKIIRENILLSMNLAVDWIGGNIFFSEKIVSKVSIDNALTGRITVCTKDGKFCRGIVETREAGPFSNFAIHPLRGLVFYSSIKDVYNNVTQVMMASMDGTQKQVLIETNFTLAMVMAIDYLNHDLYIRDTTQATIQRINIDTKKTTIIASNIVFSLMDSMVYHDGFLYSTEFHGHIQALEVTRENARAHLVSHMDSFTNAKRELPPRMAINDSSYQLEPSHDPCQELDCPWICVIVPSFTAKCLCPDGYTPSMLGTTCIPSLTEIVEHDNLTFSFKSHIGLESMKEYCKAGQGCLNGGSCRGMSNNTRIVCDCLEPYDGLYCERRKPILSDEAVLILILVIIFILLSIAIGCGVYWFFFYRKNKKNGVSDTISLVSKSSNGRFEDNPLSL